MPIKYEEIYEACELIARQDNLKVCINESLKGAGIAGLSAFTLGVLFGPVGIAVGGAVGGIAGSMCKQYTPLWQIMAEMKPNDKARLTNHMMKVVQGLDITDGVMLMALITNPSSAARGVIVKGLSSFFGQMLAPS